MLDVLLDLQVDLLPAFVLLKELSQLLPLANIILLQEGFGFMGLGI